MAAPRSVPRSTIRTLALLLLTGALSLSGCARGSGGGTSPGSPGPSSAPSASAGPSIGAWPSDLASPSAVASATANPLAAYPGPASPEPASPGPAGSGPATPGAANPGAANPGAANPGAAVPAAAAPDWIQPGLTVVYDGIASYKEQYMTSRGVLATITSRVTGSDGLTYVGDYTVQNVLYPNLVQSYQWSFTNGEPTLGGDFVIWVDPTDPTHAYGYPWTIVGQSPYEAAGWTWAATQMIFRVPDTPGEEHIIYDTQSGLVLYRDTDNPHFMQQYRLNSITWE